MSWTDVFPVFTEEMVEEYEKCATKDERAELETFYGIEKIVNPQEGNHVVSFSLFWKNMRSADPELPQPTRERMQYAREVGMALRFEPWPQHVEPLLAGMQGLRKRFQSIVFRVYLALDLEFLIDHLVEAGCEIYLMKSSSIRHSPGSLWRFLPIGEEGKVVTIADVEELGHVPEDIARSEAMIKLELGTWRVPLTTDFRPDGEVSYQPFATHHLGMRGGWRVRELLNAFTWHCLTGRMLPMVNLPGGGEKVVKQAKWPDYGFDEWFLTAAVYPRVVGNGVLSFVPTTARSLFLTLDVEYVTWANPNSQVVCYPG